MALNPRFLFALLAAALICTPTLAQTQCMPAQAGTTTAPPAPVRTAAREQALAELDHPDRLARIGALEDILGGQDAVLIDFALRKIMSGTDQEMKAVALRHLLSDDKRDFIFKLSACGSNSMNQLTTTNNCKGLVANLSGAVPLHITDLQQGSGQFTVYSPYSMHDGNGYASLQGKVQGTNVNMAVNLGGKINGATQCIGNLSLTPAGSLDGRIQCGSYILSGSINLN